MAVYDDGDVTAGVTLNSNYLERITYDGGGMLFENADYTVSGSTVTIKKSVFEAFSDDHSLFPVMFDFEFTKGGNQVFAVGLDGRPALLGVSVSGEYFPGSVLTAVATFSAEVENPGVGYQWQSSSDNVNFANIGGAASQAYTVKAADIGKYLRVVVTPNGTNVQGQKGIPSAEKAVTDPRPDLVSVSITGDAAAGLVLTAAVAFGKTAVNPDIGYRWQSSSDNETFANIGGASSETYTVKETDAGKYLRVVVTSNGTNVQPGSVTSAAVLAGQTASPGKTKDPDGPGGCQLFGLSLVSVLSAAFLAAVMTKSRRMYK